MYSHHHCHHHDVITLIGSCPGLWTPGAQSEEFWTLYSLCWLSLLQRILILVWYFALMCRITHNAGDMLIGVDWAVFWCNHWKYVDPGDGNLVMTKSGNMVIGDPDWRRKTRCSARRGATSLSSLQRNLTSALWTKVEHCVITFVARFVNGIFSHNANQ